MKWGPAISLPRLTITFGCADFRRTGWPSGFCMRCLPRRRVACWVVGRSCMRLIGFMAESEAVGLLLAILFCGWEAGLNCYSVLLDW